MTNPYDKLVNTLHTGLTAKDMTRLKPHLSGWVRLNEILMLGTLSAEDLRKLILIEITERKRRQILRKLVSRLKSTERQHLLSLIDNCLKT
jgi:hypothetical protein